MTNIMGQGCYYTVERVMCVEIGDCTAVLYEIEETVQDIGGVASIVVRVLKVGFFKFREKLIGDWFRDVQCLIQIKFLHHKLSHNLYTLPSRFIYKPYIEIPGRPYSIQHALYLLVPIFFKRKLDSV